MNPEAVSALLQQLAPTLTKVLLSKPARIDIVHISGERLIIFLRACPSSEVQLMANAIDPSECYSFEVNSLRQLAMPFGSQFTARVPEGGFQ